MKIKRNDTVQIISGADKGKTETLGVFNEHFLASRAGETVSLIALIALAAFIIFYARSAKEEDA